MSRAIDISNQRFGKLIALFDVGSKNKLRIWNCKCDCGSFIEVAAKHLKSGNNVSCGCYHKEAMVSRRTRIIKSCKLCQKSIEVKKSHSKIEGTYCSRDCMSLDYSSRLSGNSNPNFKNVNAHSKEWRNKWTRDYYKKNPDKRRERNRNIKAFRKGIEGKHTEKDVKWKLAIQQNKCYWCDEKLEAVFHVDHVIPVSKGGSNWPENIVVSCADCNLQKKALLPEQWLAKSNCRSVRVKYATGRYSKNFGVESSNSSILLGG